MFKRQFNTWVPDETIEQVKALANERGSSQSAIVIEAINRMATTPRFRRDRACTKLGITADRAEFVQWCIDNEVPLFGTLAEWESYLEQFDTGGDSADLHATQADCLGVPQ